MSGREQKTINELSFETRVISSLITILLAVVLGLQLGCSKMSIDELAGAKPGQNEPAPTELFIVSLAKAYENALTQEGWDRSSASTLAEESAKSTLASINLAAQSKSFIAKAWAYLTDELDHKTIILSYSDNAGARLTTTAVATDLKIAGLRALIKSLSPRLLDVELDIDEEERLEGVTEISRLLQARLVSIGVAPARLVEEASKIAKAASGSLLNFHPQNPLREQATAALIGSAITALKEQGLDSNSLSVGLEILVERTVQGAVSQGAIVVAEPKKVVEAIVANAIRVAREHTGAATSSSLNQAIDNVMQGAIQALGSTSAASEKRAEALGGLTAGIVSGLAGSTATDVKSAIEHLVAQVIPNLAPLGLSAPHVETALKSAMNGIGQNLGAVDLNSNANLVDVGTRVIHTLNTALAANTELSTSAKMDSLGGASHGLIMGLAIHAPSDSTKQSLIETVVRETVEKFPSYSFSSTQQKETTKRVSQTIVATLAEVGWNSSSNLQMASAAISIGLSDGMTAAGTLSDTEKKAILSGAVAGAVGAASTATPSSTTSQNTFIENTVKNILEIAASGTIASATLPTVFTQVSESASGAISTASGGDSARAAELATLIARGARESLEASTMPASDKIELLKSASQGVVKSLDEAGVSPASVAPVVQSVVNELLTSLDDLGIPAADLSSAVKAVTSGASQSIASIQNLPPSSVPSAITAVVRGSTQAIIANSPTAAAKEEAVKAIVQGTFTGIGQGGAPSAEVENSTREAIATLVGQIDELGYTGTGITTVISTITQEANQSIPMLPISNIGGINVAVGSVVQGVNAGLPNTGVSTTDKISLIERVTQSAVQTLANAGVSREQIPNAIKEVVADAIKSIDDFGLTPAETSTAIQSLATGVMQALPTLNAVTTTERKDWVSAISEGMKEGLATSTFSEPAKIQALSGAATGIVSGLNEAGIPAAIVPTVANQAMKDLVAGVTQAGISNAQAPAAIEAVVSSAVAAVALSGATSEADKVPIIQQITSAASTAVAQSSLPEPSKIAGLQSVSAGAVSGLNEAGITTTTDTAIGSIVNSVVNAVDGAGISTGSLPQAVAAIANGATSSINAAGVTGDASIQSAIQAVTGGTVASLAQTTLTESSITQAISQVTQAVVESLPSTGLSSGAVSTTVTQVVNEAIEATGSIKSTVGINSTEITAIASDIANQASAAIADLSSAQPSYVPPASVSAIQTAAQTQATTATAVVTDTTAPVLAGAASDSLINGSEMPGLNVYQEHYTDLSFATAATDNAGALKGVIVQSQPAKGSVSCAVNSLVCRYTNSVATATDSFSIKISDVAGNLSPAITVTVSVTAKVTQACSPTNSSAAGTRSQDFAGNWGPCSGFTCAAGYFANGDQCLQSGFTMTYSPWGSCDAAACTGSGAETRTIADCRRASDNVSVNSSFCVMGATLTRACQSPVGTRSISVANGTQSQTCDAGSTTWISDGVTCLTGYEEGPSYTCTAKNCGALSIANGSVSTPSGTTFSQPATYSCDTGYRLIGTATRTCQADASWSGSAPSCSLINRTLTLAGGATLTKTSIVPVAVTSDVTHEYAVFENGTCTGPANWQSYDSTFNHDFGSASDGTLTLSAKFRNTAGEESLCVSNTITLDTLAPTAILVGAPAGAVNSAALSVSLLAVDITHYKYKWGSQGSTDCSVTTGYSAERVISEAITDSLSGQGAMVLCVIGRDEAGNYQSLASATQSTWIQDTINPQVELITASTADGHYNTGKSVSIQIKFTEAVTVTGSPSLILGTTPTQRSATYAGGSGSDTLNFTYTVQAGDTASVLDYVSTTALNLNGGSIKDSSNLDADLTLAAPGGIGSLAVAKAIVIDTSAPSAPTVSLQSPSSNLSNVTTPVFRVSGLEIGATVSIHTDSSCATGAKATGSASSATLDLTSSALSAGAHSFYAKQSDAAGNSSACSSAGVAYTVDSVVPTVLSVTASTTDGSYKAADVISIEVTMSETVNVIGTPLITLNTTPTQRTASYSSGSGSNTLVFTYTVQATDTSADLDYASTSALALNSGTIKDASGNNAILTLSAPGAAGSIGAGKAIVIDTTAPAAFSITGVTGGSDSTADAWLASTNATTNWGASTGADSYDVTIYQADGATVQCALQNTTASTYAFTGCALTNGVTYKIKVMAKDTAGNTTSATNDLFAFTVDTTPPGAFTITGATGGTDATANAYLTGANLTVNWNSSSGAASYDVTIYQSNGSTVQCATENTASTTLAPSSCALTDGTTYKIKVAAKDSAGNTTGASNDMYLFTVDRTAPVTPTLALLTPNTSPGNNTAPTFRISSTESGATVSLHTDSSCATGTKASGTASGATIDLTSSALTAGSYTFYAKQVDTAGLESSCSAGVAYILDLTAPTVTLTSMTGGGAYKGGVSHTIAWTASDAVELASNPISVEYSTNGGSDWNTIASNIAHSGVYKWTLPSANSTTYRVRVTAQDAAGNSAVSASGSNFTVDSTGPAVPTFASITPTVSSTNNTPAVKGIANADTVTIVLHAGYDCSSEIGSGTKAAFEGSGLLATVPEDQATPISAQAFDAVGNISDCTFLVEYIHDITPPTEPSSVDLGSVPIDGSMTPTIGGGGADGTGSAIVSYEVQITDYDGVVLRDWAPHELGNPVTGLDLKPNYWYLANLRAIDAAGNIGPAAQNTWTSSEIFQAKVTSQAIAPNSRVAIKGSYMGRAVAISEDQTTLVIGAPRSAIDANGTNAMDAAGAVLVFVKSGASWVLQQKLVPSGTNARAPSDEFGSSVAISGDTIVIGAPFHAYDEDGANQITNAGAAYIFTRSGSTWTQQQKLIPTGTNARGGQFGTAVTIIDNSVVIGAPYHEYDGTGSGQLAGAGAAFVFTRSGSSWSQQAKLVATGTNARTANSLFGKSLSMSLETLVIGASQHGFDSAGNTELSNAGAVFVFTRSGSTWGQQAKLVPTGANARMGSDGFGSSVSISGDTLVAGANYHDYDADGANSRVDAGAAFVFIRSGTEWSQQQKLVASGTNARSTMDNFGMSVAVYGDTAIVGSPFHSYDELGENSISAAGAAFVYVRSGGAWTQQKKLVASGLNSRGQPDGFGTAIALVGTTALLGSPQHKYDESGGGYSPDAGAAFVFTESSGVWSQQAKLTDSQSPIVARAISMNTKMGKVIVVSPDGSTMVVGAPDEQLDASNENPAYLAGAAYVYVKSNGAWILQQKLAADAGSRHSQDQFGASVAIDGDTIVVGAPFEALDSSNLNPVGQTGAAYVFTRTGSTWTLMQKLSAPSGHRYSDDYFGTAVGIYGTNIVIGAPQHDYDAAGGNKVNGAGAAFRYTFSGGVWAFAQKLVPHGDYARASNEEFGISVAVHDDIAIGAPKRSRTFEGDVVEGVGAVYTFRTDDDSPGVIVFGEGENGGFGTSVAISNDMLVVGAPDASMDGWGGDTVYRAGAVFTHIKTQPGDYVLVATVTPTGTNGRNENDNFGRSVALQGSRMIVGTPNHRYDESGSNELTSSGAAWVFDFDGAFYNWSETRKIVPQGTNARNATDQFGTSVAIGGNTIAVGAPEQDTDANGANYSMNAGAVFVFGL